MFKRIKIIRKKLSKVRVGLPSTVVFSYNKGIVTCLPKERKWIIEVDGKKITHYIKEGRLDVTKYKARLLLKLAIIKELREYD